MNERRSLTLHHCNLLVALAVTAVMLLLTRVYGLSAIRVEAVFGGAMLSVLNLVVFEWMVLSVVRGTRRGVALVLLLLFKLPLIVLLISYLISLGKEYVLSALIGFFCFVPAVLLFQLCFQEQEPEEGFEE